MPPAVRQFLFRRIHDAVQITGYYTDDRLMPGFGDGHAEEVEQRPNMVFVTVRMLATKAANGKEVVRLKIGRARVQFVGVLMDPRTRHIVLAGTQRRLVKPPRLQRGNDRVLLGLRGQNVVRVVTSGCEASVTVQKASQASSAVRLGRVPIAADPQSPVASSACQAAIRSADTGTERRPRRRISVCR